MNSTVKESLTYTYKIVPKEGVLGCCAFAAFADGCRVEGRSISPYTAEVDHTSSSLATSHAATTAQCLLRIQKSLAFCNTPIYLGFKSVQVDGGAAMMEISRADDDVAALG